MADMEEMAVLIKDQRAEIKALKHRLNQGEEAARNGNVWLEDVNLATNESVFINPFEGITRETMPRGFISNFKEMKQAAKESVQTKMKLVKTEAHVRELEAEIMTMVRELGATNSQSREYEISQDKWRQEASRLAMWGEVTEQVTYERITSLTARVAELESQLASEQRERRWAVDQRTADKAEADKRVAEAERQRDTLQAEVLAAQPFIDQAREDRLEVQRQIATIMKLWPDEGFLPTALQQYWRNAKAAVGEGVMSPEGLEPYELTAAQRRDARRSDAKDAESDSDADEQLVHIPSRSGSFTTRGNGQARKLRLRAQAKPASGRSDAAHAAAAIGRRNYDDDEFNDEDGAEEALAAVEPVTATWSQVYDESSGYYYYYNNATQETTWEEPPDYDGPGSDIAAQREADALAATRAAEEAKAKQQDHQPSPQAPSSAPNQPARRRSRSSTQGKVQEDAPGDAWVIRYDDGAFGDCPMPTLLTAPPLRKLTPFQRVPPYLFVVQPSEWWEHEAKKAAAPFQPMTSHDDPHVPIRDVRSAWGVRVAETRVVRHTAPAEYSRRGIPAVEHDSAASQGSKDPDSEGDSGNRDSETQPRNSVAGSEYKGEEGKVGVEPAHEPTPTSRDGNPDADNGSGSGTTTTLDPAAASQPWLFDDADLLDLARKYATTEQILVQELQAHAKWVQRQVASAEQDLASFRAAHVEALEAREAGHTDTLQQLDAQTAALAEELESLRRQSEEYDQQVATARAQLAADRKKNPRKYAQLEADGQLPPSPGPNPFPAKIEAANGKVRAAVSEKAVQRQALATVRKHLLKARVCDEAVAGFQAAVDGEAAVVELTRESFVACTEAVNATMQRLRGELQSSSAVRAGLEEERHSVRQRIQELRARIDGMGNAIERVRLEQASVATFRRLDAALAEIDAAQAAEDERVEDVKRARVAIVQEQAAHGTAVLAGIQSVRLLLETCGKLRSSLLGLFADMDTNSGCVDDMRAVYERMLACVKRYQVLREVAVEAQARGGNPGVAPTSFAQRDLAAQRDREKRRADLADAVSGTAAKDLRAEVEARERELTMVRRRLAAVQNSNKEEVRSLTETADNSIMFLKSQVEEFRVAEERMRIRKDAEISTITRKAEVKQKAMGEVISTLQKESHERQQWIHTLREEAEEAARVIKDWERRYSALERVKSDEINDLVTELKLEVGIKNTNITWVAALKKEVAKLLEEAEEARRQHAAAMAAAHKEMARLRREIWRRDETGRRLRTDVDCMVLFFLQSLAGVSGFNNRTNELMGENGCCEALAGFCHSRRPEVQTLAARALGRCGWNGASEAQVMNTLARQAWMEWVNRLAAEGDVAREKQGQELRKQVHLLRVGGGARVRAGGGSGAQEGKGEETKADGGGSVDGGTVEGEPRSAQEEEELLLQEVYTETPAQGVVAQFGHVQRGQDLWELEEKEAARAVVRAEQPVQRRRMSATVATIVDVQSQAAEALEEAGAGIRGDSEQGSTSGGPTAADRVAHARAMRRIPLVNAPNIPNQLVVGRMDGCIARLLELTHGDDPEVALNAVDALAVLALTAANRQRIGRTDGLVDQAVALCRHTDMRVVRMAAALCGNMGFNHLDNQKLLGIAGGIEALVSVLAAAMRQGQRRRSMLDQRRRSLSELRLRGSVMELARRRSLSRARRASQASQAGEDAGAGNAQTTQTAGEGTNGNGGGDGGGDDVESYDETTAQHTEQQATKVADEVVHLERAVGVDIDVLENATAALATLTSKCDDNARRLGDCGGVGVLVGLTTASITAEHEIIHANAAEALVNATRLPTGDNANLVRQAGVASLVLLCGSQHVAVQRNAALVLGNVGQDDTNRRAVGAAGGVEALFVLAESPVAEVQANACWALANLAWTAENQERIGRFLPTLLALCEHPDRGVQAMALKALANALYYQNTNRFRVFDLEDAVPMMLRQCGSGDHRIVAEATRALGAAAYNDHIAQEINRLHGIPTVLAVCQSRHTDCAKFAAFALGNIALNDVNKRVILHAGGPDILVRMQAHDDRAVRDQAHNVMQILGDLATPEEIDSLRKGFDVHGLLRLVQADSKTVAGMALDSLAEELSKGPHIATQVAEAGGLDLLVKLTVHRHTELVRQGSRAGMAGGAGMASTTQSAVDQAAKDLAAVGGAGGGGGGTDDQDSIARRAAVRARADASVDSVLVRILWALRTMLTDHDTNKAAFGVDGIPAAMLVLGLPYPEMQEAAMAVLVAAVSDVPSNCRKLLHDTDGLASLIAIAEGRVPGTPAPTDSKPSAKAMRRRLARLSPARQANAGLAVELLQLVGPFNWIECANCGNREPGGRFCASCGHRTGFLMSPMLEDVSTASAASSMAASTLRGGSTMGGSTMGSTRGRATGSNRR